jgi:hypothetical protein
MSTWDDYRKTCMHGIREDLDSHSCSKCQEIAQELGYDTSKGITYIFTSQAQINKLKEDKYD